MSVPPERKCEPPQEASRSLTDDMQDLDALQGDDLAALLQIYPPTLYSLWRKIQSGEE